MNAQPYRKKPVIIRAWQLPPRSAAFDQMQELQDLAVWCSGQVTSYGIVIHTLEGDHLASPGDFVIQGVQGEFYPCKPDIFATTYEPAQEFPAQEPAGRGSGGGG
jgi:hypothetical protein